MLICYYYIFPDAPEGYLGRYFLYVAKRNPEHMELEAQDRTETIIFPCDFSFDLVSEWFDYTQPIGQQESHSVKNAFSQ